MDLWGNILKETTKIGHKRHLKKSKKLRDQTFVLKQLLRHARKTSFGETYHFSEILNAPDILSTFSSSVPITNYETFYKSWLSRSLKGKKNVIWPGKITYYALSSGTTNSASKRIPVTDDMIRQFQKTTVKQIVALHNLDLPSAFFESSVLIIGGSTKLIKKKRLYKEGDLSGILAKKKSFMLSPFTKPGKRISQLKDWDKKMDAIVEKAPKWDIGIIAGVPSWISILLERIIERYQLDSIHDIWPNFSVYMHGGIFLEPYRNKIDQFCDRPLMYQNTYLASEGYFAYQTSPYDEGLKLMISDGVFYEFVSEDQFHLLREERFDEITTLNIEEVEENTSYALIISTCAGLWRYSIGDVIEFIDLENKRIEIIGRVSFSMSSVGEHLSDGNMVQAIKAVSKSIQLPVEEFCLSVNQENDGHIWYIGTSAPVDTHLFQERLDEYLSLINDDYKSVRKYVLKSPQVIRLETTDFYNFMKLRGKIGGQNKFPRVIKGDLLSQWETYIDTIL